MFKKLNINFPVVPNGKIMVLVIPIFKHIRVLKNNNYSNRIVLKFQ